MAFKACVSRWKFGIIILKIAGELKYLNGKLFGECFVKTDIFFVSLYISSSELFPDLILVISSTVLGRVVRMLLSVSKQKIIFCCRRSCEKREISVC